MKRTFFLIFFLAVAFVVLNTAWADESSGNVTINSPIQKNYEGCDNVTVTGTYTLTRAANCCFDIETWYSQCAWVGIIVDGVVTGSFSLSPYQAGIDNQFSITVSKAKGSHHTVVGQMQAAVYDVNNCGAEGCGCKAGDIIGQDSRDIMIIDDDPCCGVTGECCPVGGGN